MPHERTKRRLAALELQHEQEPKPVLVFIEQVDGTILHNGLTYADIETALDVLKPHDYIVAKTIDYSKEPIC